MTTLSAAQQPSDSPLTFIEWQSLQSFFRKYPELRSQSQLLLIQLLPGESSGKVPTRPGKSEPEFTAGFALLRGAAAGKAGRQLIYFRIRDHMRRMGMARRALYKLLNEDKSIELDLMPMPDDALGQDDQASQAQFRDLYRGVRIEFELKARDQARNSR